MEHRHLGTSALTTAPVALGTMMFGAWGNPDPDQCTAMVRLALEGGVNLFDTADIYDRGTSEVLLGRALRGVARDRYVLASKCGNPMSDTDPSTRGLSRRWILRACEDSLARLGVEHLDLYQAHRPDPDTPLEETVAAFDELVRAGKIRAVGTSCFAPSDLDRWSDIAAGTAATPLSVEQPPYSLLARGIETAVLPTCARHAMTALVWAPLNGGWLTGKYQHDATEADSRARREPTHFDHADAGIAGRKRVAVRALAALADRAGLSLIGMALGFVLARPEMAAALIGPRTPAQLIEVLRAGTPPLTPEVLAAIDQIVAPGTNLNARDAG
jgi:aryl-alcohol dehydrogenase-like predicted oxidoreductase